MCTGGSITDLVQGLRSRGAQLSEKQISYILRETIQALIYLHENHCMHRDIKGKTVRTMRVTLNLINSAKNYL